MKRTDWIVIRIGTLATFTLAWYNDTAPSFYLSLGLYRFSLNVYKLSLIVELWFLR